MCQSCFFLCLHLLFPMMENQQESPHATIKSRNEMICLSPVEVERANVEPALEHLIHESIAGFSPMYNYLIFF